MACRKTTTSSACALLIRTAIGAQPLTHARHRAVKEPRLRRATEKLLRFSPGVTEMNQSDIKHLFDYTEWANGLAFNAAAELSDESLRRDVGISHGSIFGTLLHMAGAEWIWLERWHGRSPAGKDAWALWKTESCADLATLNERWGDVVDRRARL